MTATPSPDPTATTATVPSLAEMVAQERRRQACERGGFRVVTEPWTQGQQSEGSDGQ